MILEPYLKKHPLPLTFIFDRQKWLVHAVQEVFQDSHYRFCFRQMYNNFKKMFKSKHSEHLSWGAGKAYRKEEYTKWMKQLLKDKEDAKKYLLQEPCNTWLVLF